jgi:subtilisin-like proprotein convertase family protein
MHRSVWLLAAVVAVAGVCLGAPEFAGAATFSNTGAITINDGSCTSGVADPSAVGKATPYPSTIDVSGLGAVTDVNVTVTGLSHTFPDDVDVLLVGPQGQSTLLMADTGDNGDLFGVNLTFDDAAAGSLPDQSQIVSGTYKPTVGTTVGVLNCSVPASFPSPAPMGTYGSSLSVFNGTDPNGTWSLYVIDDSQGDTGSISGGWSLEITAGTTPEQKISDLQDLVAGMGIHHGITNALESKLQHALDALAADDTAGACYWMQSFVDLVNAQTGKKISSGDAQQLIDAANEIRTQLGC